MRRNMIYNQGFKRNSLPNEVIVKLKMLRPLMIGRVCGEVNRGKIVSIELRCIRKWNAKFTQKDAKPSNLTRCFRDTQLV